MQYLIFFQNKVQFESNFTRYSYWTCAPHFGIGCSHQRGIFWVCKVQCNI